jgi:hypothetical protein
VKPLLDLTKTKLTPDAIVAALNELCILAASTADKGTIYVRDWK